MRSGLRGMLVGALALIALQTLVQPGASGRLAGLFGVPAKVARRIIDPTVPAIPDNRARPAPKGSRFAPASASSGRRYPDPFATGAPQPEPPPTPVSAPPGGIVV